VIFRHGLSVYGLTTAASLWITSAIGTLYGVGFYGLAVGGTVATLIVLAGLRLLDEKLPHIAILDVAIRYRREAALPEAAFRALADELGLDLSAIAHKLLEQGKVIELAATLRGKGPLRTETLAERLCADERVLEFEILPRKD
jgi:putative Mg2+ transporter-C (MgtC) family protein